jgi:hypothetical protein
LSWLDDIRAMLGQAQAPLRQGAEAVVQNAVQPAFETGMNALGASGNLARGSGMTLGRLIQGDQAGAQDIARRAFTGMVDPSQHISGQEAVGGNAILSDIATDPLAMGGIMRLGQSGGSALMRRLGSSGVENVAPSSASSLRSPGLSTYSQDAAGNFQVARPGGPASNWTPQNMSSAALGEAEGWTGRPLSNIQQSPVATRLQRPASSVGLQPYEANFERQGNALEPSLQRLLGSESTRTGLFMGERAGPLSSVNANAPASLRGFNVVHDVGTDLGRPSYGAANRPLNRQSVEALNEFVESGNRGQYFPSAGPRGTIFLSEVAPDSTLGHEANHAITNVARRTGQINLLPTAQGRLAARMQEASSPLVNGLGGLLEESQSQGISQGRGFLRNLQGQLNFAMNPHPAYIDYASSPGLYRYGLQSMSPGSPTAGQIYEGAPALLKMLYAGGVGAGAAGIGAIGGQ